MAASKSSIGRHLRVVWPQWQGGGVDAIRIYASEFPLEVARRGYALGASVLQAVLPPHDGPTVVVPVTMSGEGTQTQDGIEAKPILVDQLACALKLINEQQPDQITTLGGECSVSVAPFSYLANRYGDDVAVVWIDAHPDVGTSDSEYDGYHAMAVSTLVGKGDPEITGLLPGIIDAERVALVGLHSWTEDDYPHIAEWGLHSFSPKELSENSTALLEWLQSTNCTKVAIHFDVDSIDGNEHMLGLGSEPHGLKATDLRRIIQDVADSVEVVGFTVAEFIPRQAMHMRAILSEMPLI
ncbi:arginase family protein [Arthrobacter oryzae]|uniref:arginase family protein n=1 Tax=Arthrobacter oryzae TaxID=409290 RepID=UPI00273ADD2F|nr:arginase family protein [Arthrobacter oryzae]WLQ05704.1 arginase family protein [Arthrobacter oryzae]